ncbi:hypothetical protein [Halomarina oriensis]|uniref:Uncharacterized protein n=1 Tax=Halomarina oriensis TaxID=671145 RepID=A0A6B0GKB3_9EURY|nr:hypothetical protein [Halomarina oriensis]MWG34321.1 hypothetical protein [Halomarina oriensis]
MNPVALPGRVVGRALAWASAKPLVVSGAVMAIAATTVLSMRVRELSAPDVTLRSVSPAVVSAVLVAHPAYAVAVLVGVGVVVFWR